MPDNQKKADFDDDSMFYQHQEDEFDNQIQQQVNSQEGEDKTEEQNLGQNVSQNVEQNIGELNGEQNQEIQRENTQNQQQETKNIDSQQNFQNKIVQFENNSPLKKYIMQISSEFVPLIDSMTVEERIAWINDAIQIKIDTQRNNEDKNAKKQITTHFFIIVIVFVLLFPLALFLVNKAIMLTFENYKYSQSNFEKLYKQRFEQDKTYLRSIQYNKKHSVK